MVIRIAYGTVWSFARNPWYSGKLASLVKKGLAKPKKDIVMKTPAPWYFDKSALSDAQKAQIARFKQLMTGTGGLSLEERILLLKKYASGPTGMARPRARVRAPVPAPTPTPTPTPMARQPQVVLPRPI